jgi:hypothetical protein
MRTFAKFGRQFFVRVLSIFLFVHLLHQFDFDVVQLFFRVLVGTYRQDGGEQQTAHQEAEREATGDHGESVLERCKLWNCATK